MISIRRDSLAFFATETAASGINLAALVSDYSALLFRVAHSILRDRAEAEDVVQDVFVRVLQHQSSLPAVRDLRVWLVRIAWNLALDRRRRIRPSQMDDLCAATLVAHEIPADQVVAEAQRMRVVLCEIDRLPAKERQALLLSTIEDLETAEIAALLCKTDSAVRALLFRARSHLRTRLKKGGYA